jgi:tRNA-splicing ligase RtcB (3'-phosphate/5'-hydroxy nucleic acid ligase)
MPEHLNPKLISWASILDPQTEQQAHTASKMPFIHPHLALGKGATVSNGSPTAVYSAHPDYQPEWRP